MKKVIGITGSIGSGKSYAVDIFKKICKEKRINAIFLDVDDIRRNILNKENIDRNQVNQKIYNDKNAMEEYKQFINPKIKKYLNEQISKNDGVIFTGHIPVRCINEYRNTLTLCTNGQAVFLTELKGYQIATCEPVIQSRRPNNRIDKVRHMFNKKEN